MKRPLPALALAFALIWLQGCGWIREAGVSSWAPGDAGVLYPTRLSPTQQYAGEVLSYMILVVTGHAGPPALRDAWRTCGAGGGLSLPDIAGILADPAGDKNRLMLYDMNGLGLSQVLYRYDARLNQFKGAHSVDGVFPSAELIALRLLLVDLMDQGRAADLDGLYRLMSKWTAPGGGRVPVADDAGLSASHLERLRAVLLSEHDLAEYLRHPFVVDALRRLGVLRDSALGRRISSRATYRGLRPARPAAAGARRALVAVLPSITGDYRAADPGETLAWGFSPDPEYARAVGKMKAAIAEAFDRASAASNRSPGEIDFLDFVARPLVVHPGNVDAVAGDLCPEADIVIVILGRNVDRSLHLDAARDVFPNTHRFYFDIMDVKYDRIADEIAAIGAAAARKAAGDR